MGSGISGEWSCAQQSNRWLSWCGGPEHACMENGMEKSTLHAVIDVPTIIFSMSYVVIPLLLSLMTWFRLLKTKFEYFHNNHIIDSLVPRVAKDLTREILQFSNEVNLYPFQLNHGNPGDNNGMVLQDRQLYQRLTKLSYAPVSRKIVTAKALANFRKMQNTSGSLLQTQTAL